MRHGPWRSWVWRRAGPGCPRRHRQRRSCGKTAGAPKTGKKQGKLLLQQVGKSLRRELQKMLWDFKILVTSCAPVIKKRDTCLTESEIGISTKHSHPFPGYVFCTCLFSVPSLLLLISYKTRSCSSGLGPCGFVGTLRFSRSKKSNVSADAVYEWSGEVPMFASMKCSNSLISSVEASSSFTCIGADVLSAVDVVKSLKSELKTRRAWSRLRSCWSEIQVSGVSGIL